MIKTMKTIQIEDEVFAALESRGRGFNDSPNEVIKRLLTELGAMRNQVPEKLKADKVPPNNPPKSRALVQLVQSPEYLMADGKRRYFTVLEFLYHEDKDTFSVLEQYGRGKRVNFARDPKLIRESGNSTYPQKIRNTPYYALTNLPNLRKRKILADALKIFKYPSDEIELVLRSLPDSGISRRRHEKLFEPFDEDNNQN